MPLLGTSPEAIDLAEDRGPLRRAARPARAEGAAVRDGARARAGARGRPAGRLPAARAAELRARRPGDGARLRRRSSSPTTCAARAPAPDSEIFLDRFLENAIEVDVDAICDGEDVWIGGVMQHVEEAGIHSGDSACVLPPHSLGGVMLREIREATTRAGARARRRRADERAVRRARRRALRDRGQPARVADRAVRLQGDRAAAGQDRLPGDARRAARRHGAARRRRLGRRRARLGQGGGAALRPVRGRGRAARARDALDRRGDGRRRRTSRPRSRRRRRRRARTCRSTARSSSR